MEKNNKKLNQIFGRNQVSLAYIFGSFATGRTIKNSDVDVAVMLNKKLNKMDRFEIRLKLIQNLKKFFGREVEVVVLNDTTSLFFKYIIIHEGKLIYQKNEGERLDYECRLMGEYFDFQPFLNLYNKNYVKNAAR